MISLPRLDAPTEYTLTQQDIEEAYDHIRNNKDNPEVDYCHSCVVAHVINKAHGLAGNSRETADVYHAICYLKIEGVSKFRALLDPKVTDIVNAFDGIIEIPDQTFKIAWTLRS